MPLLVLNWGTRTLLTGRPTEHLPLSTFHQALDASDRRDPRHPTHPAPRHTVQPPNQRGPDSTTADLKSACPAHDSTAATGRGRKGSVGSRALRDWGKGGDELVGAGAADSDFPRCVPADFHSPLKTGPERAEDEEKREGLRCTALRCAELRRGFVLDLRRLPTSISSSRKQTPNLPSFLPSLLPSTTGGICSRLIFNYRDFETEIWRHSLRNFGEITITSWQRSPATSLSTFSWPDSDNKIDHLIIRCRPNNPPSCSSLSTFALGLLNPHIQPSAKSVTSQPHSRCAAEPSSSSSST